MMCRGTSCCNWAVRYNWDANRQSPQGFAASVPNNANESQFSGGSVDETWTTDDNTWNKLHWLENRPMYTSIWPRSFRSSRGWQHQEIKKHQASHVHLVVPWFSCGICIWQKIVTGMSLPEYPWCQIIHLNWATDPLHKCWWELTADNKPSNSLGRFCPQFSSRVMKYKEQCTNPNATTSSKYTSYWQLFFRNGIMQSTIAQKTNCNKCMLLFAAELQQCQWNQVSIPYNGRGYHNRLQKSLDDC